MKVGISQYAGIDAISGLPLAAGVLIATARRDPELAEHLQFAMHVARKPVDQAVRDIGAPDVLGLSMYPWNTAYTLAVGAKAKMASANTLVVAGGPAVPRRPETARAFLEEHAFIDVLVFGEGELAFRELLRTILRNEPLGDVPSIAFRAEDGSITFTSPPVRVLRFEETGSPYLDGTFDALVAKHPDRFAMALIETNRGCPFSCTFCDWSMTKRVVEFPYDRVIAEIDWATAHHMSTVCFTDANFGMRKRDKQIAEHLAARKAATGSPRTCYFYLTKNNHQRNLNTINILQDAGISYCVGLAVQDFDDDVLVAVKRDNIQTSHSETLGEICAKRGIRTHNELILGLPAQTYDSFVDTILRAMPSYALHEFRIFICRLIDNTDLASAESRETYGVQSRKCLWRPNDSSFDPIIHEHQEVVVATHSLPIEDWRRTCHFAYFSAAAYNQRLLRVVLRYLAEHDIDRRAYLEHLVAAMHTEDGVYHDMGHVVDRLLDSMLDNGPLALPIDSFGDDLYEMAEAVTATVLCAVPEFFETTLRLTREFIGNKVNDNLIEEMMRFQQLCIPAWSQPGVRTETFQHDWVSYAQDSYGKPLQHKPITVRYEPPAYVSMPTKAQFASLHLACVLAGIDMGQMTSTPLHGAVNARRLALK